MGDLDTNILLLTGDAVKSAQLERMLSNMTNSYKLYWLKAYLDEVFAGAEAVTFRRMASRMVSGAWYTVNYFHLSLGLQDQLGRAIATCKSELGLPDSSSESEVLFAVETTANAAVAKALDDLCKYVPYRLIRPFYEGEIAAERARNSGFKDGQLNQFILECNVTDSNGALYRIREDAGGLVIDESWATYIRNNRQVIEGWVDMRLVRFLQMRNPSVPAIPFKLRAPKARDLTAATNYWREAFSLAPLTDIYTGLPFTADSFTLVGPLSIDHYIPWSFVLHDEIWNLTPTFRDVNSAKNDRLPVMEDTFDAFCRQQFIALLTVRHIGRHRKALDQLLTIDANVLEYQNNEQCLDLFSGSLRRAIVPLYQIALNSGFGVWRG